MSEIFHIIGLIVLAFFILVYGKGIMSLLLLPVTLFTIPGQKIAGPASNWDHARVRYSVGLLLAVLGILISGSLPIVFCVSFIYYLRQSSPSFPVWLLWLLGFVICVGTFFRAASDFSAMNENDYQERCRVTILAWNIMWFLSGFIFVGIALKPQVSHSYLEWMPYTQYLPGEQDIEAPYLSKVREYYAANQSASNLQPSEVTKLQNLVQSNPVAAREVFQTYLDKSISACDAILPQLESLTPPRRFRAFHEVFIEENKIMSQHLRDAAEEFRKHGDYDIFQKTLEDVSKDPVWAKLDESIRGTGYSSLGQLLGSKK